MYRVTLLALTMPPSPMLFREFETEIEAERWRLWASCLPCHARITRNHQ
jgi:hypothetical protein